MLEESREIDRRDAQRELRNGALIIAGFTIGPVVLASLLDSSVIVYASLPVIWGVIMCIRGAITLARL